MNKKVPKIKYPKFLLLIGTFALAYALLSGKELAPLRNALISLGYIGTFLAGICYSYGFTAGPATAVFLIVAREQNILLAGFIGGLGALAGDLVIFRIIRHSFADEIKKLSKEKIMIAINQKIPYKARKYCFLLVASFIIASPLPDEIGVCMLAASRTISTKAFSVVSYLLNTGGIFVILILGKVL